MNDQPIPALVLELRYALDVLEERSHLGLDDEVASKLKDILLRRIGDAEEALTFRPANRILAHDSDFCE
jgi:hypothetical protein